MGYNSQQQAKKQKKIVRQKTSLLCLTARKNVLRADDLANEHTHTSYLNIFALLGLPPKNTVLHFLDLFI